jgi:MFS transporter, DHA3 family, macrolide efflux protein
MLKKARGTYVFAIIWFGQLVSLFGSGLTGFALGIWVYQQTGSVTKFALISLFTTLPGIVISPLAGALVDRWDRRWTMILNDAGAGLSTSIVAVLLLTDKLQVWHIYLAMAAISTFNAFQWPAYTAATTLIVPKQHLGRASGMVQVADAASQILSPALAGILVAVFKIHAVLLIDVCTFGFSLLTLLFVRFPKPETTPEGKMGQGSLLQEAIYGWTYITSRPGLWGLLIFFAASNFFTGVVSVLVTPLVLAFAPVAVLGTVLTVGGIGMLAGSIVMSVWGGGKRRIYSVLSFTLLGGVCIVFAGVRPSVVVFFFTAFFYFFGEPLINGSSQAIWQSKIPADIQGRVFAVRRAIAMISLPLAYVVAGPLADLFESLLAEGGLLASSIGRFVGVGRGYGIALLFVLIGTLIVVTGIAGYLYPHLRLVEDELPDAIVVAVDA